VWVHAQRSLHFVAGAWSVDVWVLVQPALPAFLTGACKGRKGYDGVACFLALTCHAGV